MNKIKRLLKIHGMPLLIFSAVYGIWTVLIIYGVPTVHEFIKTRYQLGQNDKNL